MKHKALTKTLLALTTAFALFGCSQQQQPEDTPQSDSTQTEDTLDAAKAGELLSEKLKYMVDDNYITLSQKESGYGLDGQKLDNTEYTSYFYRDGTIIYNLVVNADRQSCSLSYRDLSGEKGIVSISLKKDGNNEIQVTDVSQVETDGSMAPGSYTFAAYALRQCFPRMEVLGGCGDAMQVSDTFIWDQTDAGIQARLQDTAAATTYLQTMLEETVQQSVAQSAAVDAESVEFSFDNGALSTVEAVLDARIQEQETSYGYMIQTQFASSSTSDYDWDNAIQLLQTVPEKGDMVQIDFPD